MRLSWVLVMWIVAAASPAEAQRCRWSGQWCPAEMRSAAGCCPGPAPDAVPPRFAEGRVACEPSVAPTSAAECARGDTAACARAADCTVDVVTAAPFYERACQAGHAEACFTLGFMAQEGIAGPRDYARAVRLHERACTAGAQGACHDLAALLIAGAGVPVDAARAGRLLRASCQAGHAQSCRTGAFLYHYGSVALRPDHRVARELYDRGCALGDDLLCDPPLPD
jgi:hypothetical protein